MPGLLRTIHTDLRQKALWCYESDRWGSLLQVLLTDGTAAMIIYRLMQWSRRWHLKPLELFFNKLNAVCANCIIGRGAEFGPGFVLVHSTGVVINGKVQGGANVFVEHQVTIGAASRLSPNIGSNVFIGAGAKIIGPVAVGDGARIGANAVVVHDVPAYSTVVGIPAKVVRTRPLEGPSASPADEARPLADLADSAQEIGNPETTSVPAGAPERIVNETVSPGEPHG
jgi:serine O-acetyltransferase